MGNLKSIGYVFLGILFIILIPLLFVLGVCAIAILGLYELGRYIKEESILWGWWKHE